MELQQLKYFREAEREHVTRAAEKLFVSQSAISRAVTQLEEELGVLLLSPGTCCGAVALWAAISGACQSGT